jgi:hypothetical protein
MRYTDVRLASLATIDALNAAVASIEGDPWNSYGDWHNCGPTTLKDGAEHKIDAIESKIERMEDAQDAIDEANGTAQA